MKKTILLVAVFSCLLALCSCSAGNTEESKTSTVSETESKVSVAESSAPDESIVSNVVSNNTSTESNASESSVDELADWELVTDHYSYNSSYCYLYKYIGNDKVVNIPASVGPICPSILRNDNVEEIIIPATVECVKNDKEDRSFWGCKNLKKVTILNPDFNFQIDTSPFLEMFGLETYQYDENYVREITIVGYKGSTAEKLKDRINSRTKNGMKYKLTFEAIEE